MGRRGVLLDKAKADKVGRQYHVTLSVLGTRCSFGGSWHVIFSVPEVKEISQDVLIFMNFSRSHFDKISSVTPAAMITNGEKADAVHVSTPTVTHLPETVTSHAVILEPYHVELLDEYDYVSREYLMSGVAAGESYCTRLLLRCPADVTKFTGFVVEEPSHLWGGTSIWRHINRWLMRNGELWL